MSGETMGSFPRNAQGRLRMIGYSALYRTAGVEVLITAPTRDDLSWFVGRLGKKWKRPEDGLVRHTHTKRITE